MKRRWRFRRYFLSGTVVLLGIAASVLLVGGFCLAEQEDLLELSAALLSAVCHEGGHFLAIFLFRPRGALSSKEVRFRLTAGGAEIELAPWSNGAADGRFRRAAIYAAGSFMNLVLAALFGMSGSGFASRLGRASVLYGVLNLLPIQGLDGGNFLNVFFPFSFIRECLSYLCLTALWLSSLCLLIAGDGNLSAFLLPLLLLFECLTA